MPFEDSVERFRAKQIEKVKIYANIAQALRAKNKVSREAIIFGPLGTWDNLNDRVTEKNCSLNYANMMQKLIVSENNQIMH